MGRSALRRTAAPVDAESPRVAPDDLPAAPAEAKPAKRRAPPTKPAQIKATSKAAVRTRPTESKRPKPSAKARKSPAEAPVGAGTANGAARAEVEAKRAARAPRKPGAEAPAPRPAEPGADALRGTRAAAKPRKAAPRPTPDVASAKKAERPAPAAASPADPSPRPEAASAGAGAPGPGAEGAAHPFLTPEVELFATNMARLWEESGKATAAFFRPRDGAAQKPNDGAEIADVARTLGQVAERWMSDPARVAEAQRAFASDFLELWTGTMKRLSGEEVEPTIAADPKDARFKDPEWTEHPVFDFIRQAYLHASRWADRMVEEAGDDLDPHVRHKATFYVKLLSNAASPSNFLPTNPELIRETLASKGENLVRGMKMLAEDIDAGGGGLRIRQTDRSGFEVGRNLAVTPGKVVFRNDLFELIQYAPATEMARTRPVLIVPPWINKFYVLDLTPEKSMIAWAVSQGLTVFCISWVNPDASHARLSFDDYMRDGVMKAAEIAREICGTAQVDAAGYCVGGTLLAVTLAYMAAKDDRRIASATLMTTQVDFTHAGDLKVFVDEEQVAAVEAKMAASGYLEGASMANAFNMIRSNDMIFPFNLFKFRLVE